MATSAKLEGLSCGFRRRYLSHDEITAQCRAWADAFPELVRLGSIGRSSEGRELWLLTIAKDPERTRPAVWVDGNMHASELCGSSAALAIAEDVIQLHLDEDLELHGLPRHVREIVRDVPFHVLPRMSPDGAEAVLVTGKWVRSVPRDNRHERLGPRWVAQDLDGDGLALVMRMEHPAGEYVESRELPGVLLPRTLEDEGPYYKLYPEGVVEPWDGHSVPDPHFLSDNFPDLNRNFPWAWAPEPHQVGAGAFPGSEPESRAVIEAATRMPELFAWLDFHTFGGVFIRPLGNEPDKKLDASDRALFTQIGQWCEALTGYPMVSGFEEFTYQEDKPLHGDLSDFAYHARGCIAYVCELWDLFRQIDMPRAKRFCDHYTHATRDDLLRLARWDAEANAQRIHRPWKRLTHPQLGEVEVGGFDPRVGIWNPPLGRVAEICAAQSAAFLRVAALAPRLGLVVGEPIPIGADSVRVEVEVTNVGYLPTYILSSAKSLPHNEEVWLDVSTSGSLQVLGPARRCIGHLEGWGRGVEGAGSAMHVPRSRGGSSSARQTLVLEGRGECNIRIGSCRMGRLEKSLTVG